VVGGGVVGGGVVGGGVVGGGVEACAVTRCPKISSLSSTPTLSCHTARYSLSRLL
jgi:hypothetical protein